LKSNKNEVWFIFINSFILVIWLFIVHFVLKAIVFVFIMRRYFEFEERQ